jgi:hypothetical protein
LLSGRAHLSRPELSADSSHPFFSRFGFFLLEWIQRIIMDEAGGKPEETDGYYFRVERKP